MVPPLPVACEPEADCKPTYGTKNNAASTYADLSGEIKSNSSLLCCCERRLVQHRRPLRKGTSVRLERSNRRGARTESRGVIACQKVWEECDDRTRVFGDGLLACVGANGDYIRSLSYVTEKTSGFIVNATRVVQVKLRCKTGQQDESDAQKRDTSAHSRALETAVQHL